MDPVREFLSAALSATLSTTPAPITASATASYQFNPDVSQQEACKIAEDRAKLTALYKTTGQEIHSSKVMACNEKDSYACDTSITTFEGVRGIIQSYERTSESVSNWVCTVGVNVKVAPMAPPPKTLLQANAEMDRGYYKPGDTALINITTNDRGFVNVFTYDPINDNIVKIYPTRYKNQQRWTYVDQPLRVDLPLYEYRDQQFPYFLIITVTETAIHPLDSYSLHKFYKMWDTQPVKDKVLIRTSFYVRNKT